MASLALSRPSRRRRPGVGDVLAYVYLIVFSIFILFPIFWIITNAFKDPRDILNYPPVWIPRNFTLVNFDTAIGRFNGLADRKSVV